MKPQDILLIIILIIFVLIRRPKWLLSAGLILFILSIPLFAKWIFFTAEHFVWWGALYIVISALVLLFKE